MEPGRRKLASFAMGTKLATNFMLTQLSWTPAPWNLGCYVPV